MMGINGRFFAHMGASKLDRAICGPTVGHGMRMTNGSGRGMDALELEHSQLIILWATNTKLTNRHLWPTIERARERGARLVVIDPIRTLTADAIDVARGDRFIQPLPGTDIAMMLAMMHVIIRDGLTNDAWIADHTSGFDELRDAVADWTPERAAAATGVDAAIIEQLAVDYATVRPVGIRTLIGAEHHENGAMFHRTLACLPALTGAWAQRGGGIAKSVGSYSEGLIDGLALMRPDLERADGRREPRTLNMSRLGEILTAPHAGENSGPGVHAADQLELQSVGHRSPSRTDPPRDGTRRPVHRRPRTVPHRHRPIRRHRAACHHPDRERRRRVPVGSPLDRLERCSDRPSWRDLLEHRHVPSTRPGDGLHRAITVRRRRDPAACCVANDRHRRTAPGRLGASAVPRRRPPVRRRPIRHTVGSGTPRFRRPGANGPTSGSGLCRPPGRPVRRPRSARSIPAATPDPEAPHEVLELRLLRPSQARPDRGRPVRRTRGSRRGRSAGSSTVRWRGCGTTGPR